MAQHQLRCSGKRLPDADSSDPHSVRFLYAREEELHAAHWAGFPTGSNSPEGLPLTDIRQNRFGFYFMDDWKVSRKLTMNIGIRYEYNSTAKDVQGLWRSISFETRLTLPGARLGR